MKTEKRTYFSPISDVGFKKIFAAEKNEDLRVQLLNAIIRDGSPVVSTELLDPVHPIGLETTATFDLYCKREDGSRIIVEMQRAAPPVFLDRALAYSALAILDQWRRKWKYQVDRVYFIGILDAIVFRGRPDKPFTTVRLMADDEHFVVNDKYLQIFVELPKLAGVAPEAMNDGEKFLHVMSELYGWDHRPAGYQAKSLDRLFAESAYSALTDEEQAKHDKEMTTEQDYQDALAFHKEESFKEGRAAGQKEGREEGRKEGRKEGRQEGADAARLEIARNMKASGVSDAIISECTGLPEDKVNNL